MRFAAFHALAKNGKSRESRGFPPIQAMKSYFLCASAACAAARRAIGTRKGEQDT